MMNKFGVAGTLLCTLLVSCQATNTTELSSADIKKGKSLAANGQLSVDSAQGPNFESPNFQKVDPLRSGEGGLIANLDSNVKPKSGSDVKPIIDQTAVGSIKPTTGSFVKNGIVQSYVPPKKGSIFTWRNNWASLPEVIAYRADGIVKFGSKEYVKFTSTRGLKKDTHAYYDVSSFSLKGYRDAKNAALVTYKPAEQRYKFPMKAGDKWVTSWKSMDHTKKQVTEGGGVVKVIKFEMLKIGAKQYDAVKVRMPLQRGAPKGMSHYVWFSPELGITIKEQIGNGSMNWTQILEKVELAS